MDRHELAFWLSVGIVSIVSVALFKVLASHKGAPEGLQHLAGAI
jgi:hypothetical protein